MGKILLEHGACSWTHCAVSDKGRLRAAREAKNKEMRGLGYFEMNEFIAWHSQKGNARMFPGRYKVELTSTVLIGKPSMIRL